MKRRAKELGTRNLLIRGLGFEPGPRGWGWEGVRALAGVGNDDLFVNCTTTTALSLGRSRLIQEFFIPKHSGNVFLIKVTIQVQPRDFEQHSHAIISYCKIFG